MNIMPQKRDNIENKFKKLGDYPKYYIAKYKSYTFFYIFSENYFSFIIYKDNEISFCKFDYNKKYNEYTDDETKQLLKLSSILFDEALSISENDYIVYINMFNKNVFKGYQEVCQFVN